MTSGLRTFVYNEVSRQFTGEERDPESGTDYFNARQYAYTLGRFLQPDEFQGGPVDVFSSNDPLPPGPLPYADIVNPQSLNKYTYTYNNPLRYTDPDGHVVDLILDVVAVTVDVSAVIADVITGSDQLNSDLKALGTDVVAAAVPFVPAVAGATVRAANAVDNAVDAAKVIDGASDVKQGVNMAGVATKGKVTEQAVEAELKAEGRDIAGKQVTVNTAEGPRRTDFLVREGSGVKAVEAKSANARRTAQQVKKDQSMATKGGTIVGKNAPEELRNKTMKIDTEVRKPSCSGPSPKC